MRLQAERISRIERDLKKKLGGGLPVVIYEHVASDTYETDGRKLNREEYLAFREECEGRGVLLVRLIDDIADIDKPEAYSDKTRSNA